MLTRDTVRRKCTKLVISLMSDFKTVELCDRAMIMNELIDVASDLKQLFTQLTVQEQEKEPPTEPAETDQ